MTFDYSKTAATATRLLEKFGRTVYLKTAVGAAYNPATGTSTVTETSYETTGVILDFVQSDIDGTLIKQGDKRILVDPAADQAPETGDKIQVGSDNYNVLSVETVSPAGTVVLFDCHCRR